MRVVLLLDLLETDGRQAAGWPDGRTVRRTCLGAEDIYCDGLAHPDVLDRANLSINRRAQSAEGRRAWEGGIFHSPLWLGPGIPLPRTKVQTSRLQPSFKAKHCPRVLCRQKPHKKNLRDLDLSWLWNCNKVLEIVEVAYTSVQNFIEPSAAVHELHV